MISFLQLEVSTNTQPINYNITKTTWTNTSCKVLGGKLRKQLATTAKQSTGRFPLSSIFSQNFQKAHRVTPFAHSSG